MQYLSPFFSRGVACLLGAAIAVGCGADGTAAPSKHHQAGACGDGESASEAGACEPAGLPTDAACPPGQVADGPECRPAGVAPSACGDGFTSNDAGGCDAILPVADCPKGKLAVPGDTSCRDVAPCGDGTWGATAVDATTEYVDASYAGTVSDGSAAHPWTTIGAAVSAAVPTAIIAIAAGSYPEDVVLEGKPVRLYGRCPAMVEITGTGVEAAAVLVQDGSDESEIHSLAITGPKSGIAVYGATDVAVDRVWIHDAPVAGVGVITASSSAQIADSLIEDVGEGVIVDSAPTTVSRTAIRDTTGYGLDLNGTPVAQSAVRGSLVERAGEVGIAVTSTRASVETTLVRDTRPRVDGHFGRGIDAQFNTTTLAPADLTVTSSVIAASRDAGISIAGSTAQITATTVRDTRPNGGGALGTGIVITRRSTVTIEGSAVYGNTRQGIGIGSSTATIEGTSIHDTMPGASGAAGLAIEYEPLGGQPSTVTVRTSAIERNDDLGIFVAGSDAIIESSAIRDTVSKGELSGRGIDIQISAYAPRPSTATITASLIERNAEVGIIVVASSATLQSNLVRDTRPNAKGEMGDGISVVAETGPATADIAGTRVEGSARAGISNFGGSARILSSAVACSAFDLEGEPFEGASFSFDGSAHNACGCQDGAVACQVQSAGLSAPPAITK